MRLTIWLTVGAVVLTLLALSWQFREPKAPAPIELAAKPPVIKKKEVLKVPADLSWGSLSEKELREFTSYFGNATAPNSCKLETLVKPGETIVTEAYEGKPGEFVFSKLTPVIKTRSDGTKVVEVKLESFVLSVSGDQNSIISETFELPSRSIHGVATRINDARYDIKMSAEIEGTPPMINFKADGGYVKRPPLSPMK